MCLCYSPLLTRPALAHERPGPGPSNPRRARSILRRCRSIRRDMRSHIVSGTAGSVPASRRTAGHPWTFEGRSPFGVWWHEATPATPGLRWCCSDRIS
eukprot:scaffold2437_cov395-Prasinococcus_capsulatus_cf.AAC.11